MIKRRKKNIVTQSTRGSNYRGVSRNGRKWQVSYHSQTSFSVVVNTLEAVSGAPSHLNRRYSGIFSYKVASSLILHFLKLFYFLVNDCREKCKIICILFLKIRYKFCQTWRKSTVGRFHQKRKLLASTIVPSSLPTGSTPRPTLTTTRGIWRGSSRKG